MVWSAIIGAVSAYIGTAFSAAVSNLPTGPMIVLVAAFIFFISLMFAPVRGVFSGYYTKHYLSHLIHRRQGLLALARHETILDEDTLHALKKEDFIRTDGVATQKGLQAAQEAETDERFWNAYFEYHPEARMRSDVYLYPAKTQLTRAEITEIQKIMRNSEIKV